MSAWRMWMYGRWLSISRPRRVFSWGVSSMVVFHAIRADISRWPTVSFFCVRTWTYLSCGTVAYSAAPRLERRIGDQEVADVIRCSLGSAGVLPSNLRFLTHAPEIGARPKFNPQSRRQSTTLQVVHRHEKLAPKSGVEVMAPITGVRFWIVCQGPNILKQVICLSPRGQSLFINSPGRQACGTIAMILAIATENYVIFAAVADVLHIGWRTGCVDYVLPLLLTNQPSSLKWSPGWRIWDVAVGFSPITSACHEVKQCSRWSATNSIINVAAGCIHSASSSSMSHTLHPACKCLISWQCMLRQLQQLHCNSVHDWTTPTTIRQTRQNKWRRRSLLRTDFTPYTVCRLVLLIGFSPPSSTYVEGFLFCCWTFLSSRTAPGTPWKVYQCLSPPGTFPYSDISHYTGSQMQNLDLIFDPCRFKTACYRNKATYLKSKTGPGSADNLHVTSQNLVQFGPLNSRTI